MAPAAATLADELVEEVLLHLPLDDPAGLVRAALVCRHWRRLVSGPGFRRRFRELHRAPPLLGFLGRVSADGAEATRFVPTSSFRAPRADRRGLRALGARHGRVLLHAIPWAEDEPRLVVWDPVTDEQRDLPPLPRWALRYAWSWNAAVLCAVPGCGHLDCRRAPFHVVVAGTTNTSTLVRVYSSETGAWGEPAIAPLHCNHLFVMEPSTLVGDAVYFKCYLDSTTRILEYNVATREISLIRLTPQSERYIWQRVVLMASEDGRLGFTTMNSSRLCMWLREVGDAAWALSRVVDLDGLLPAGALVAGPHVAAVVDGGEVIFMMTAVGVFIVDLKSGQIKNAGEAHAYHYGIVPYTSYCTPALGAVSTGEGPWLGASMHGNLKFSMQGLPNQEVSVYWR